MAILQTGFKTGLPKASLHLYTMLHSAVLTQKHLFKAESGKTHLHMKLKRELLLLSSAGGQCLLRPLAARCLLCCRHPLCYC